MSMAITHFAVGGALTAVVALYLLPPSRYARTSVLFGGLWAMVPDVHWVTPVFATELYGFHSSVFANVFWFHETLDVIDPTDSREVAALALGLFVFAVVVGDHWSYTTRELAGERPASVEAVEPVRSLAVLSRIAGILALAVGSGYLAVGTFVLDSGAFQGLYLGIGMALLGSGVLGIGGRISTESWVTTQVPRLVRQLLWSVLSIGLVLIGGVLLAVPLRSGISVQTGGFAGVGCLLLVLSLLLAQLRLRG